MKFFTAIAHAKFAEQLLATAGLDFNVLTAAGDVNALKAAIEAKVAAASKPDAAVVADLTGKLSALESKLASAATQLAAIEGDNAALAAGLVDAGVKVSLPATATNDETKAAVAAAIKSRAATLAQEQLAAAGHPPIAGESAGDPTAPKNKPAVATGLARVGQYFAEKRK